MPFMVHFDGSQESQYSMYGYRIESMDELEALRTKEEAAGNTFAGVTEIRDDWDDDDDD